MKPQTKKALVACFKMATIMTLITAAATMDAPQKADAPKTPVPVAAQR